MSPSTVYVDWAEMEAKLSARAARSLTANRKPEPASNRPRMITTVADEVAGLRHNVKDTAGAVLTWLAAVADHQGPTSLDSVLDRCLRPGPDVQKVNYAALASEIRTTLGVEVSAKRVKTAIRHLRLSREKKVGDMQPQSVTQKLGALEARLQANYGALVSSEQSDSKELRRSIGVDVLTAVRCAASRLIEQDYGEGIPGQINIDRLEDRFLDYVRDVVRDGFVSTEAPMLVGDLHRLLVSLSEYDQSCECDMRLVVDGGRVVADLMGPESLPGLMARLNLLVVGRDLVDSVAYCGQLLHLADAAAALHEDPQTKSFMNWVRRLPSEQRLPSPNRVSSYCLNNAATHILERLYEGQLEPTDHWLDQAKHHLDRMRRRDSGFRLIKTTEVIYLTVSAKLTGDATEIEHHFARLGKEASLSVLQDLIKYDNCAELVQAARQHATRAIPDLKYQLIHLG